MCTSILSVALYVVCVLFFYLILKLFCNIVFENIIFLIFDFATCLGVKIWNIQHHIYDIAFTSLIFISLGWDLETMHLILMTFSWARGLEWMSHAIWADLTKRKTNSWSSLFHVVCVCLSLSLCLSLLRDSGSIYELEGQVKIPFLISI